MVNLKRVREYLNELTKEENQKYSDEQKRELKKVIDELDVALKHKEHANWKKIIIPLARTYLVKEIFEELVEYLL